MHVNSTTREKGYRGENISAILRSHFHVDIVVDGLSQTYHTVATILIF